MKCSWRQKKWLILTREGGGNVWGMPWMMSSSSRRPAQVKSSSDKCPEVESLAHMIVLLFFFFFWEIAIPFSTVAASTSILTNSVWESTHFLHILSNTCDFYLFDNSHFNRHKLISYCSFTFLAVPWGLWDLSSPMKGQAQTHNNGSTES